MRLTRKRLSDALITLLMQKPVREITVRELTELANVSRELSISIIPIFMT